MRPNWVSQLASRRGSLELEVAVEEKLKFFIKFDGALKTVLEFKASLIAAGFARKKVLRGAANWFER